MNLSNESLVVILLVGIVAGWLAGQIVRGGGFGLIGDLIVGIIGAFIGDWLLPRLDIHLGVGTVGLVINATIGASFCSSSSGCSQVVAGGAVAGVRAVGAGAVGKSTDAIYASRSRTNKGRRWRHLFAPRAVCPLSVKRCRREGRGSGFDCARKRYNLD